MRRLTFVLLVWLPALALGGCDPTWCDCAACARRPGVRCDLCEGRHVFVLGTGRSGSTTILEALNSLPGVTLSGENHASIEAAEELFRCALAQRPCRPPPPRSTHTHTAPPTTFSPPPPHTPRPHPITLPRTLSVCATDEPSG